MCRRITRITLAAVACLGTESRAQHFLTDVTAEASLAGVGNGNELTLHFGLGEVGEHMLVWDGLDDRGDPQPAGVYVAQLRWPGGVQSHKLVPIR